MSTASLNAGSVISGRFIRLVCVAVASASLLGLPGFASGAEPALRPLSDAISVDGGPCLERVSLASTVAAVRHKEEVDASLSFTVVEDDEAVVVLIRREGGEQSERKLLLNGAACQKRTEVVAMVVATVIDSLERSRAGAKESAPAAAPAPSSPPSPPPLSLGTPPVPPSPDAPGALTRPAVWLSASVQGLGLFGVLPKAAAGGAASFDMTLGRRFDVRFSALATEEITVPAGPGTADASLLTGRLDGCVVGQRAAFRLRGCAGGLGGAAFIEGHGLLNSRSPTAPFAALSARFDVRFSVGERMGLLLSADGFATVLRPTLDANRPDGDVETLGVFPLIGVAVGLGSSIDLL